MKPRFLLAIPLVLAGVIAVSTARPGQAQQKAGPQFFKTLLQKNLEAWNTLDPANAAPFYAKDADAVFYDIAPLKYNGGWEEYAAGVKKILEGFSSMKIALGDDSKIHQHGSGLAWGTTTWHLDMVKKDGSKEALDGRWTMVWEKRGKDWLIVHEHVSAPLPEPASAAAGQSLYARLGGYDALAAVTDDFIGRLVKDPRSAKFFAGHSTDSLKRIRQLVVDQLCEATGGPCVYIGRNMKTSHAGMGITEDDWQSAASHLAETLDKFKVPKQEKDQVLSAVSGLKKDIVQPNR